MVSNGWFRRVTSVCFHPTSSIVAAACGRDLFTWDVDGDEVTQVPMYISAHARFQSPSAGILGLRTSSSRVLDANPIISLLFLCFVSVIQDSAPPTKRLETTIGFLCLYFHPNGKWLITCEVRSLGSGQANIGGGATTPHFCIR